MIIRLINSLIYWKFRRNNAYPCPEEVIELVAKTPLKSDRIINIALCFYATRSLEKTAERFDVTRERVRQILWKLYWSVHRDTKNKVDLE